MRIGAGISKGTASYTTLTYLWLFGLAITIPLLILLGALLFQSASAQREQLERRVLQVLDALVNYVDRDLDRDLTILNTLATSQALASENWRAFYDQATMTATLARGCRISCASRVGKPSSGRAIWMASMCFTRRRGHKSPAGALRSMSPTH